MAEPAETPTARLYLVTPRVSEVEAILPRLGEALAAGDIACVLLDIRAADENAAKKAIRAVAAIVQPQGAALLIAGADAVGIAARAGADGVHVADPGPGLAEALDSLRPERIVGVSGLRSRHDAMTAAEAGVDYVMFGEPFRDGALPSLDQVLERTRWWAELFEIPCVAYAPGVESVALLASAGADFIALGGAFWSGGTIASSVAAAARSLEARV